MDNPAKGSSLDLDAFASKNFDPNQHLWEIMPDDPDQQLVSKLLSQAQMHHNQLTQQIYGKVVAQHAAMEQAKSQIQALTVILGQAKTLCDAGKESIHQAKDDVATGSLKVLALNGRREEYLTLAKSIQNIKKVTSMKAAVQQQMQNGDFLKAISLCLECQNLISECKGFECLKGMGDSVKALYNEIIKLLGVALADACRPPFNTALYKKTINAFRLTRKASRVIQRINSQTIKFVSSATIKSIQAHVLVDPENIERSEAIKQMKSRELLKLLREPYYPACFNMIVSQMCDIMYANYQLIQFHENQSQDPDNSESGLAYGKELGEGVKANTKALWDEIQRHVTFLCQTETLLSFKSENFLAILDMLNTFVNIGEQFSNEPAHKLRGIIKTLSKGYFDEFHNHSVETLRHQLCDELWTRTTVHSRLNPRDIKEINDILNTHFPGGVVSIDTKIPVKGNKFFELYPTQGNPFSSFAKKDQAPSNSSPSLNSSQNTKNQRVDEELLGEPADNKTPIRKRSPSQTGPIITPTLMNIVKLFAQYLDMMKILNNISWDICQGLFYLSSVYTHTIMNFFMPSTTIPGIRTTRELRTFVQTMNEAIKAASGSPKPVVIPKINAKVDMTSNTMFGILPASTAAESLSFLNETLKVMKPFIQALLPKSQVQNFQQSCSTSIDTLPEIRLVIYKALSHKLIPSEPFIQAVNAVNWNCNEQPHATANYINSITNSFENVETKFEKFLENNHNVPYRVVKQLWESLIAHVCECLVEGFCTPNCSPVGRAMMGIDFQSLQHMMERVAVFKIPRETILFVDTYIKAYYLMPEEIEQWLKEHTEYSHKQLTALVNCGTWNADMKRKCLRVLGPAPAK